MNNPRFKLLGIFHFSISSMTELLLSGALLMIGISI